MARTSSYTILLLMLLLISCRSAFCQNAQFQVTSADTSLRALLTRWAAQTGRTVISDMPIDDVALLDVYKHRSPSQLNASLDHASFADAIGLIFKEPFVLLKDQEIEAFLDERVFQTCILQNEVKVVASSSKPGCDIPDQTKISSVSRKDSQR